jgi:hypothetical protein
VLFQYKYNRGTIHVPKTKIRRGGVEALIEQRYEFIITSQEYMRFLQMGHESYPEFHPTVVGPARINTIFSVSVPEPTAVILKLAFGPHLREIPNTRGQLDELIKQIEILKKRTPPKTPTFWTYDYEADTSKYKYPKFDRDLFWEYKEEFYKKKDDESK